MEVTARGPTTVGSYGIKSNANEFDAATADLG